MARKKSILEDLAEMPWWVSVVMSALAYVAARWLIPGVTAGSAAGRLISSTSTTLAPYVAILFLLPAPFAVLHAWQHRKLLGNARDTPSIRSIPWHEFEALIALAYRRLGYEVEERGGRGRDGGVDLMLREEGKITVVQCKHWNRQQVGVSIVRELIGTMNHELADAGIIVKGGSFTADAHAFAKGKAIELVNGQNLLGLLAIARGESAAQKPEPKSGRHTSAPNCPTCNSAMVLRTAKRGANAGGQFWGCTRYPSCRGTREVDNAS